MDGTSIAALADEEMAKAEQEVWPKGEISRRLQALGWSSRGYADETGVAESTMRRIDSGERLLRRDLVEQRAAVMRWIELEEKLRLANPMPVWPGRDPVGVAAKHRRRPKPGPRRVSDASEAPAVAVVRGPVTEELRDAMTAPRGGVVVSEPSEAEAVPPGMVRLLLPSPDLPSLDLAQDAPVDQHVVRLVVDCVGRSPQEMADVMDAPAVARTLRRWMGGADPAKHPIRAESAAWLRDVLGVLRDLPPEVTAWVRYRHLLKVWRVNATAEQRRVFDAVVWAWAGNPPDGLVEWDAAVVAALRRRPDKLAGYQTREGGAEDQSVVPGVSVQTFSKAVRRVLKWVVADGSLDELAPDDPAHEDARTALRETHVAGMMLDAWVLAAQAKMEAMGYTAEEEDESEPDAVPEPQPKAVVVSDRRGQAEARPRLGLPAKPLVDLTRGRG